ncbi:uncharacterized protein [Maniola hyperantus]|uniref:uncharacterized protein isoform X4 n=1 Tax=Aphantopus hyperantus TaxID=2795564 RepID=UPI0037493BA1
MDVLTVLGCLCLLIATTSAQDVLPEGASKDELVDILQELGQAVDQGLGELETSPEDGDLEGRRQGDSEDSIQRDLFLTLLGGHRRFDIENMLSLLLKVLEATGKSPSGGSGGGTPGGAGASGGASPAKPGGGSSPGKAAGGSSPGKTAGGSSPGKAGGGKPAGKKRRQGDSRFYSPDALRGGDGILDFLGLTLPQPPQDLSVNLESVLSSLRSAIKTLTRSIEVYNSFAKLTGRRQAGEDTGELMQILQELGEAVEEGLQELETSPDGVELTGRRQEDPEGESPLSQVLENLGQAAQKGLDDMLTVPELGEKVEGVLEELQTDPEEEDIQGRRTLPDIDSSTKRDLFLSLLGGHRSLDTDEPAGKSGRRFFLSKLGEMAKDFLKKLFDSHRRSGRRFFLSTLGEMAKDFLKKLFDSLRRVNKRSVDQPDGRRFLLEKLGKMAKNGIETLLDFGEDEEESHKVNKRSVDQPDGRRFFLEKLGQMAKNGIETLFGEDEEDKEQTIHVVHEESSNEQPPQKKNQSQNREESSRSKQSKRGKRDTLSNRSIDQPDGRRFFLEKLGMMAKNGVETLFGEDEEDKEQTIHVVHEESSNEQPPQKKNLSQNTGEVGSSRNKQSKGSKRDTRQIDENSDEVILSQNSDAVANSQTLDKVGPSQNSGAVATSQTLDKVGPSQNSGAVATSQTLDKVGPSQNLVGAVPAPSQSDQPLRKRRNPVRLTRQDMGGRLMQDHRRQDIAGLRRQDIAGLRRQYMGAPVERLWPWKYYGL